MEIKKLMIDGYEEVIEAIDSKSHLHCFIAIHDTTLGPALGGTRIFPYSSKEGALKDVLRLAKGMTQKSALAGVGLGGGKSVIIADPSSQKNEELLHAFAEVLNTLKGRYIAAEDVGSSVADMAVIKKTSPYVAALANEVSSGDPSPFTAWGVYQGILAAAMQLWGVPSIKNRTIAIQGLGHVGCKLAEFLFWAGADLIATDLDPVKMELYKKLYSIKMIPAEDIYSCQCDIFSPCAMGGILNEATIPKLNCLAVAGSANNQLQELKDGSALFERNILYAPDVVINAGGIINASMEFSEKGYCSKLSRQKVDEIYDTLLDIFEKSNKLDVSPAFVVEELAMERLLNKIHARKAPIVFFNK